MTYGVLPFFPALAGILLKTNTPPDVLKGGGSPQSERHYN